MGCHALLQGTVLTQGSNPGLPHCRQILDCLSPLGSPMLAMRKSPCIPLFWSAVFPRPNNVSLCILWGQTIIPFLRPCSQNDKPQRKLKSDERREFHLWVCLVRSFYQTSIEQLPHDSLVLETQPWLRHSFCLLGALNLVRWSKMFNFFVSLSHFSHP